ncbi:response regulator [Cohnella endophytica]|uniref:Circadian input-output histidine kinase CikA n=1 Tax=Cohnella endophytica TaxID=2419778 RepID=A0A494YAA2_9BACL|nr:response regulator [Cohnella endophytica]RKP56832.1 response regulator [Cohnella endophytica]
MFRTLRFKLVIVLLFINTCSFVVMSLINYETSNKQMNQQLIKQSLSSLKNTAAGLDAMLDLRKREAELISHSIPVRLNTKEQMLEYVRMEVPLARLTTLHVGIAGLNGDMTLLDGTDMNIGSLPAYQSALGDQSTYADIMLDSDNHPVLWLMVPLKDNRNNIRGTLNLAFDSVELLGEQLTIHSSDYKDSSILLIDRQTNLLNYKDSSLILKRNYLRDEPNLSEFVKQMHLTEEGSGEAEVFGRVVKLFYVHMPLTDWYVVSSVAKNEFQAPLLQSIKLNGGLIALTEILVGAFLYFITQRAILDRLKQILAVTKNVASGNFYPSPIRIQSNDELGTLAKSVNSMINNLQELFEPFNTFIRHNQYAMIVTDSRFYITSFNKRAVELLGYEEEDVIGQKALLLWHDQVQLKERAKYYSDKLKRSIVPDETVLFIPPHDGFLPDWEWKWITREDIPLLVSINTSIMRNPDGTPKGYVLIARDISMIKKAVESNARLLEITESAHDMIASFDLRSRIFYLNRAGHAFLGIDTLDENTNRFSQYMSIPATVRFADGLTEARERGFWQNETEIIGKNGVTRMVSITVVAHMTHEGGEVFFSTIVRDISDQKEAQRQLILAKDEAEEANRAKGSFLARMSHEIRTPLNGIIGLAYLLQRSNLSEIQASYLRQISDSSQNLLGILNAVLDYSKLEADKLTIEQVPFRLEDAMQRLSGIFSVLLGPKPVDFILHSDNDIPEWLIGDSTRLEQVLLNLGSNAIKFTNFGKIELTIRLLELKDGIARLSFCVKDTGIGMTEAQREQLFMPFVQADEKTSRKYGGTGLGLVISGTLVERMGGWIYVDSEYQAGSSFRFELAFEVDSNPLDKSMLKRPLELSVVVLEDEPTVADHWKSLLSSFGCEVVAVNAWKQADLLLKERTWDVMLIDMEAADMHGEETWVQWKTALDKQGVKIVSSTTLLGRDALLQLPDELKPAAVLVKPSSSLQVRQTLQIIREASSDYRIDNVNIGSNTIESIYTPHDLQVANLQVAVAGKPFRDLNSLPLRIIAVDDQIINRLVVKQLIEQQGIEVELMESGAEALQALENKTADLVLMDLHMPEMDGIEATVHLRKRYSPEELPIIALTADVTKEQHERCIGAGMNDVITKPIEPESLYSMIVKWLPGIATEHKALVSSPPDLEAWPELPGLDSVSALRRLDGKRQLYLRLLDKFRLQHVDTKQRLEQLLTSGDLSSAIRLVHSLSGSAGHLGAEGVQSAASELQTALQSNEKWTDYQLRLNVLLDELFCSIDVLLEQKRN